MQIGSDFDLMINQRINILMESAAAD